MRLRRAALALLVVACGAPLAGCVVVSVAGTAAGLAVDAGVGAVKLTGKAVGAAAIAASSSSSSSSSSSDDGSGIGIRFREPTAADREKRRLAEQQAEEEDRRDREDREGRQR